MFHSLWPHGLQHAGPPCPSPTPGVYSNSCPLSWWWSVTRSCPTLCDPMDCSMPGLPVHHQLTEFTQTHVHWVGDAIQPSHLLSSPSLAALNLSQHQGLFQWISSSHQVAKYWSISPSNEYSGLISFSTDWFDILMRIYAQQKAGNQKMGSFYEQKVFITLQL